VNGHSSSINEKGDKRQSQSNSDECCSRVDPELAEKMESTQYVAAREGSNRSRKPLYRQWDIVKGEYKF